MPHFHWSVIDIISLAAAIDAITLILAMPPHALSLLDAAADAYMLMPTARAPLLHDIDWLSPLISQHGQRH